MSSELNNYLNAIKNEKDTKIIPENIKSGQTIFGVDGALRNDVKKFENINDMQNDIDKRLGDVAVITNEVITPLLVDTVFNNMVFPKTVELDEAITGVVVNYHLFDTVNGDSYSPYIMVWLDDDKFYVNIIYGSYVSTRFTPSYRIEYKSSDGKTYTRIDNNAEKLLVVMSKPLYCSGTSKWSNLISKFIFTDNSYLDGVYKFPTSSKLNLHKMYKVDLTTLDEKISSGQKYDYDENNIIDIDSVLNVLEKTDYAEQNYVGADICYTNGKYYIISYTQYSNFSSANAYLVLSHSDKKLYLCIDNTASVMGNIYIYDVNSKTVTITSKSDYTEEIAKFESSNRSLYLVTPVEIDTNSFFVKCYTSGDAAMHGGIIYYADLPMINSNATYIGVGTMFCGDPITEYLAVGGTPQGEYTATNAYVVKGETFYGKDGEDTGTMQVLRYPYPYSEYHNYDYEFFTASGVKQGVNRDGSLYVLATYQPVPNDKPDTWALTGNRKMKLGLSYSQLASVIGLNSSVIKKGVTILGITGTYEGTTS